MAMDRTLEMMWDTRAQLHRMMLDDGWDDLPGDIRANLETLHDELTENLKRFVGRPRELAARFMKDYNRRVAEQLNAN